MHRKLLGELDLDGVLILAGVLHTQKLFFGSSRSRGADFLLTAMLPNSMNQVVAPVIVTPPPSASIPLMS